MLSTSWNSQPNDSASIAANRVGQLTPWQRQRLKPPSLVAQLFGLALVCVIGLPLDVLLLSQLRQPLANGDAPPFQSLIVIGALATFLAVQLPLLLFSLFGLLKHSRLRRDLAEGLIAQEDGQVIFTRLSSYRARASGQTLFTIDGSSAITLPPGAYRFFYLPRSRRILSAERQPLYELGGPKAGILLALSQAHRFRMDDLDINRQGGVSSRQRTSLMGTLVFLVVVFLAVIIGSIWQFALLLRFSPWGFLVVGGLLVLLLFLTYQRWLDLLEGRAAMQEGLVQAVDESTDDTYRYYYKLDTLQFSVSASAYRALVPGERYRVYYLPRSKRLLSIEPLP